MESIDNDFRVREKFPNKTLITRIHINDYSFNITTFFVRIVQKVIFYNIIRSTLKYVLYLMGQCIRIDKTHIIYTIRSR